MIASRPFSSLSGRLGKIRLGAFGSLAVLLVSSRSFAQAEAQKPAPNVLLLVDSSGSMEFKRDGTFPSCPHDGSSTLEKSRWIDLVEVLTGSFQNYSCWSQDRSSAAFKDEFSLGSVAPYDYGYVNKFSRAMSNNCLYGPGVVPPPSTPYAWPNKAVNTFPFAGGTIVRPGAGSLPTYPGCSGFSQASDGLLDIYKDMVRFGLMTFDARVSAGTGVAGTAADYSSGFDGNWSYYVGSPTTGHPANCTIPNLAQEVGARNAAAPPWEGRMIAFGPPNEADNSVRNRWIQEVLLSTRPYGATPIAGQLDDARQFLWNDTSGDPLDTGEQFGPSNDPNWRANNCRKSILILLTDGEPNLDLRPFCTATPDPGGTAGHCPYDRPEQIVAALKDTPPQTSMSVETYVVGFALARVTPAGSPEIACSALTDAQCSDPLNNVPEQTASKNIQACCTLNKIAAAGGSDTDGNPRKAYFAENPAELKAIFTDILDDVIQVATRTMPVFSSPGGDTASKGYKFFSAFDPQPDPSTPQLWEGILERRRYVCSDTLVPQLQYDPADGDDFAANLNSQAGDERQFYTVIGDGNENRKSVRPFVTADDDGLGTAGGNQVFAARPSDLPGRIPPAAMQVTASSCAGASSPDDCRDLIVEHLVGIRNDAGLTRCPAGGCELFGGIFHSVPTAVSGKPSELLRDESYEAFAAEMAGIARPSVLYTSTVDGFLHAFNLAPFPNSDDAEARAVDSKENNELWSFIPPAVLPVLQAQYPSTPAVLLDGVPIIKDVVASKTGEGDDAVVRAFERVASDAQSGGGFWRTVLLEGFGSGQVAGGYFALDITQPDRGDGQQPTFRWQLTQDTSGNALFGTGGTPLITTVYLGDDDIQKEVAVAVLPGGDAAPGGPIGAAPDADHILEVDPASFKSSRAGRDYGGSEAARSLTIVRLDTGEVLRTFRPSRGSFDTSVWKEAINIPAPITGQPKAFPETTGAVADRIYVGDRDGRMWRVDVSSRNPRQWSMKVLYDAFEDGVESSSQPVVLPPVLSVDDVGDVTIAYATGSQELDNTQNRVISLTERLDDNKDYVAHLNWIHQLDVGDRVTGPMVLFNSALYYAVSHPPATTGASCDVGSSKVYGAHYLESDDFVVATHNGDPPDPTTGPAKAPGGATLEITRQPGLVFGLSLEQEPTCVSAEETVSGNDSFGYGEVRMSQEVNPGRYFLTFDASGNNTGPDSRGVLEVRQQLTSPQLPVTFQSWAVVYE